MNLWEQTYFSCSHQSPLRMLLDARNFNTVSLVELLNLLERAVYNCKATSKVQEMLMALKMHLVISNRLGSSFLLKTTTLSSLKLVSVRSCELRLLICVEMHVHNCLSSFTCLYTVDMVNH